VQTQQRKPVFNVSGINRSFAIHCNKEMIEMLVCFLDEQEYLETPLESLHSYLSSDYRRKAHQYEDETYSYHITRMKRTYIIHCNQEMAELIVFFVDDQNDYIESQIMAMRHQLFNNLTAAKDGKNGLIRTDKKSDPHLRDGRSA
jgi:hypothetical protein